MKNINIEFLLKMTKSYLDGDMDEIEYGLDFPYEVELRYKDLLKEDREMAELIYDCLVEEGAFLYAKIAEEGFREKVAEEYEYLNGVYNGTIGIS